MSTVKKFQKLKEDFICEHCKTEVIGNGYTNHCPKCLWSKHVDIFPGDRLEDCKGLMKPLEAGKAGDDYYIIHECQKCQYKKKNKLSSEDDFDVFVGIIPKIN
jgi:rubredoxin